MRDTLVLNASFEPLSTVSLRRAVVLVMQDKAVVERFSTAGSQVSYLDGPDFARFLEADTDRLLKVVRKIGLS